jgi:flavin-dependent dehydrogenase
VNATTTDVLVMGGGATGQLAAAYLRMRFPELKITVVEGPHKNRPIVGESFVEITIDFLLELGLGPYLIEHHFPKYGLTYYFKPQIDRPEDRTYVVDETPTVPPLLSFQINRFTFDREVRRRNAENGVELIDGVVAGIDLGTNGGMHSIAVRDAADREYSVQARWLVDATGRNRVLGKLLGLHERVLHQKDVFWFRLANFNPDILARITAVKKENRAFVPYFATHHFFGKGNWIWLIPMRAPDNSPFISIGITYRKDVYPHGQVRTMEQFLECVGREHEMIVELVRSGAVADTNFYNSYMWECKQHYSPDRWYIIGDAGNTVDPLYSVGMALSSVQIRQIAAAIQRELAGCETREFTKDMDTAISAFHHSLTRDTTRLYECTGDAYQCHLRVHLIVTKLFHLGLPALMNDYLWEPQGLKLINRFADLATLEREAKEFHDLVRDAAANPKNHALENFIKVQSSDSMNYVFYEYHREEGIPASLSRMLFGLARLRLDLLAALGWRGWTQFRQHRALFRDLARAVALIPFHGRKLRQSKLVRKMFPVAGVSESAAMAMAMQPAMPTTSPAGTAARATREPLQGDS